jgi:hypothetical protein
MSCVVSCIWPQDLLFLIHIHIFLEYVWKKYHIHARRKTKTTGTMPRTDTLTHSHSMPRVKQRKLSKTTQPKLALHHPLPLMARWRYIDIQWHITTNKDSAIFISIHNIAGVSPYPQEQQNYLHMEPNNTIMIIWMEYEGSNKYTLKSTPRLRITMIWMNELMMGAWMMMVSMLMSWSCCPQVSSSSSLDGVKFYAGEGDIVIWYGHGWPYHRLLNS